MEDNMTPVEMIYCHTDTFWYWWRRTSRATVIARAQRSEEKRRGKPGRK